MLTVLVFMLNHISSDRLNEKINSIFVSGRLTFLCLRKLQIRKLFIQNCKSVGAS